MNSRDITRALALHFDYRTNIVVPRCNFPGWEADLLVMRESGWMDEVEIKVSVADFKREFEDKARKHRILEKGNPKWYSRKRDADPSHELETEGLRFGCYDWTAAEPIQVCRYWFAVPSDILEQVVGLVPAYAGLLVIHHRSRFDKVFVSKKAPQLFACRKLTTEERLKLMRLAYLRFWKVEAKEVEDGQTVVN